jgi:hypothetical protein
VLPAQVCFTASCPQSEVRALRVSIQAVGMSELMSVKIPHRMVPAPSQHEECTSISVLAGTHRNKNTATTANTHPDSVSCNAHHYHHAPRPCEDYVEWGTQSYPAAAGAFTARLGRHGAPYSRRLGQRAG